MNKTLFKLNVPAGSIRTEAFSVTPTTFIEPGLVPKILLAGWIVLSLGVMGVVYKSETTKRQIASAVASSTSANVSPKQIPLTNTSGVTSSTNGNPSSVVPSNPSTPAAPKTPTVSTPQYYYPPISPRTYAS